MQSMKANGYAEVSAALARVRRLRALGRVGKADAAYIEDRLEEVQERIMKMSEEDQHGDPLVA
jgi:hypothetical protein